MDPIHRLVEIAGTQQKAADLLGVNQGYLSRVLRGERRPPPSVVKLARYILTEIEKPPAK